MERHGEPNLDQEATGSMPQEDKGKPFSWRGILRYCAYRVGRSLLLLFGGLAVAAAFILLIEIGFRICLRAPAGLFAEFAVGKNGLYPEKRKIKMLWGPFPYSVETNSLGFRGREIKRTKSNRTFRIAAIGDSITDGVFVDNDATWEYSLQDILTSRSHQAVEVLNCARAGGSIDKEFCILKNLVLPLHPDLVILTFVTNDIANILGKSRQELISMDIPTMRYGSDIELKQYGADVTFWIVTKTAIGEVFYDTWLTLRSPSYRYGKQRLRSGDERYQVAGGDKFQENVKVFKKRFRRTDGIILNESFSEQVQSTIDNYSYALDKFAELCRQNDIQLLFVYFPAYSQVYDPTSSVRINGILEKRCSELRIHFLDLTPAFRSKQGVVLHLAPIDFHPNPAGNRFFANAVADYLIAKRNSGTGYEFPQSHRQPKSP